MANLNDELSSLAGVAMGDWGETVLIQQKGASQRSIQVIVDRNGLMTMQGTPSGFSGEIDVYIRNDADAGVTGLTMGSDKLKIAARLGGVPEWRDLYELVEQDAGFWRVRVRTNV